MGVQGLWKLVEPCGRMVPLEGMSNKVLAVDVSIWLHQAMKGMHDVQGAPIAVAHLLVLFHRLCKLLFYKIKPVFVFDGGVPTLKRQTMATRRMKKSTARSEANRVRGKLLKNLLKHEAIRHVLSDECATAALGLNSLTLPGPSEEEDLYKLPPVAIDNQPSASNSSGNSESESEIDDDDDGKHLDIHSLDVESPAFKALPAEVRHDILSDIKDTRKQSSWRHLDQMPQQSQDFSDFQMNRLLKRRAVQVSLEECGKEMGARDVSMQELQGLLGEGFSSGSVSSGKVAQTDTTHYMLIQKPKQANPPKGFDISEHLQDVLWSSDSETEANPANQANEGENVDGNLKPNQYPLSQLLSSASAKIVDDIAAVLEEGSDIKEEDIQIIKKEIVDEETPKNLSNLKTIELKSENDVSDILNVLEDSEKSLPTSGYSSQLSVPIESIPIDLIKMESLETIDEKLGKTREDPESVSNCMQLGNSTVEKVDESDVKEEVRFSLNATNNTKLASSDPEMINYLENVGTAPPKNEDSIIIKSKKNTETLNVENVPSKSPCIGDIHNNKSRTKNDTLNVDNVTLTTPIVEDIANIKSKVNNTLNVEVASTPPRIKDTTIINSQINTATEETKEERLVEDKNDVSSDSDDDFLPVEDSPPTYPGKPNVAMDVDESPEKEDFTPGLSETDMKQMKSNLENEMDSLLSEKGRQERMAQNVTDQMCADAQELLRLFGVPYIVAPMEAEAQCAALDLLGLTQGTITDDSDIWLFGGRIVYKNFFNQKKHVLEYRSEDISQYFKLSREEMVRLALLVGSDYTPGLPGVGPVTALEVLAAFPSPKNPNNTDQLLVGLQKFQEWVASGFIVGPTRTSLRNKVKNTSILPGFPSRAVVEAYLRPEVDNSNEQFSWAKPDIQLLEKYAKIKFGWSTDRCNELLLPVMKKLLETTDQPTIDRFFRVLPAPTLLEGRLSKRVEGAVKRLGRPMEPNDSDSDSEKPGTSRSKKRKSSESKAQPVCLDALTERLHTKTVIPQREKDRLLREEQKRKAAQLLKKGGGRGRGRGRGGSAVKAASQQTKINLSDSSDSN